MAKASISAIITGAGGGIAHATLRSLSDRYDGQVALFDINEEALAKTCHTFGREGFELKPYTLDLCDQTAVQSAIERVTSDTGRLDFLFANAGIMTAPGPFEVTLPEAINRSIDLNYRAVVTCALAAWPALAQAKGTVIVNASGAGRHPLASDVVYSASKAAAIMFARACALRTDETGIRFNAVCPGVVDTPILNDTRTGEWRDEVHDFVKAFKLIQPEEIAEVVVDLMADKSANGEVRAIANQPI